MNTMMRTMAATVALALAIGGVAWATGERSNCGVACPTTTVEVVAASDFTYEVGVAGTVSIRVDGEAGMTLTAAVPNPGWSVWIEQASGAEVEVVFDDGTNQEHFEAEFEDGAIKVRVRTGVKVSLDTSTDVTIGASSSAGAEAEGSTTFTTSGSSSTSTTVDDRSHEHGLLDGLFTYEVPDVGTVTAVYQAGILLNLSVFAPGWQVEVEESTSTKLRLRFEKGSADAEFRLEMNHGLVRVRIDVD